MSGTRHLGRVQAAVHMVPIASNPPSSSFDEVPQLVGAAIEGNRAAFAQLHRRFGPVVRAVVLCRVAVEDADDVVQETFVRGWQRLDELRDAKAFGAWVCSIARNLCRAHHRRARPHAPLDLVAEAPVAATQGARMDAQRALAALQGLPTAYAEPLALRLIEGWTGPEIARHMGMTHGSVRVNLHRGLKLLRERLAASPKETI